MKQFLFQLKWQFILLQRNNLLIISVVVTLIYAALFYGVKDSGYAQEILTLLVYNDPALIGLLFFGLMVISERNQMVLNAFLVSPMSMHHYLLARVLSLSIIGWACALGMIIAAFGLSFNVLLFSIAAFSVTFLFSLAGVLLITVTDEFLNYMLLAVPAMFFFSLPLFNYYELTDMVLFDYLPTGAGTKLLLASYNALELSLAELLQWHMLNIVWMGLLYFWSYRRLLANIKQ